MKHYLDFKNSIGRVEISEPFGFDSSTHLLEQGENYGRDVVLGDEEIELILTESHFELLEFPQQLPNGVQFDYASHAYDYFLDVLQNDGWEAEIEYILEKDGVEFSKGLIDGLTYVIEYKQIKIKVIQNTKREEIKRRLDVNIDAFSSVDLDGNTITPCQTIDMLMKAKPIQQSSEWNLPQTTNFNLIPNDPLLGDFYVFNYINQVIDFGIENTLSFIQDRNRITPAQVNSISNFIYLTAQDTLTNLTVDFSDINLNFSVGGVLTSYNVRAYYAISVDGDFDYNAKVEIYNQTNPTTISINESYTLNITSGNSLYFWFEVRLFEPFPLVNFLSVSLSSGTIKAVATSTAVDTVVKAVRFIDLLKHAVTSVGGITVNAPMFDVGGEHFNNFAFNGYLLGQVTDKPFNNKLKDLLAVVKEVNNGYQINPDSIEVLHYDDFYTDIECGAFVQIENLIQQIKPNDELALKTIDYTYKNSSKGRETNSDGSIDDIHGQTQWLFPSKKTDKAYKVELDHIRSAFLIEEQRRRLFDNESSRSLQSDDKLFMVKAVQTAPSRVGGFTATLLMQSQADNPQLKIIATRFRWDLLGFSVGSTFTIVSGQNTGVYTVFAIEPNVISLTGTASFTGTSTITVEYPLNNVTFINQTSEGYGLIEGIENQDNYSNLDYSIGRNLKAFYSLFGACARYVSGEIKNTLFEVNSNLVTRKVGETESTIDSAPIDVGTIKELRKIEPKKLLTTVFCEFDYITAVLNNLQTQKGYVRVQSGEKVSLGYPTKLEYKWATNELEIEMELKKESEFYELDVNLVSSFQINNNLFVSLYDENDILLVTPLRFEKIKINGVVYTDEIEFSDVLTELIQS